MSEYTRSLRNATARTLKWNTIDRFSSQILYAVTGIVLANVLSKSDFGLVGVILIFQAFGILFVDSGFGAALLQKKAPSERDYSTVFWFNLAVSIVIYIILYLCAPLIARLFHNDLRLIPLCRVMFISFILNGLGIVQTNRLMKEMNVKQIAIANLLGLILSGASGIYLALTGAGAWALVWQTIVLAACKTIWLWITGGWRPRPVFSLPSLKSIYRVGLGVFFSSFLNTVFLHIYSFVIGFISLVSLGIYTQADKWSKMGSASLSQIVTATFVPLLARFQDDAVLFKEMMLKVARFTGFITLPFMCALTAMAAPLFHVLFGTKWDEAIPLFQILMMRGVLIVYISLCTNYLLSLGYAKSLVMIETVKDSTIVIAILLTMPLKSVEALVWGQFAASCITYAYILWRVRRATGCTMRSLSTALWKYLPPLLPALAAMLLATLLDLPAIIIITIQCTVGLGIYTAILHLSHDPLLKEALRHIASRFHR